MCWLTGLLSSLSAAHRGMKLYGCKLSKAKVHRYFFQAACYKTRNKQTDVYVLDVLASNLDRNFYCVSSQSVLENDAIVYSNKPRCLPSKSLPVHCLWSHLHLTLSCLISVLETVPSCKLRTCLNEQGKWHMDWRRSDTALGYNVHVLVVSINWQLRM